MKRKITNVIQVMAFSAICLLSNVANAQWAYVDRGATAGASSGLCVHNGKIYSTSAGQGVFSSTDGTTWTQVINGMDDPNVAAKKQAKYIASIGSDLFVSTPVGVFKSTDDAANWTLLPNTVLMSTQSSYVHHFYKFGTKLFAVMTAPLGAAGMGTGIYSSVDGGTTWVQNNSGITLGASCYRMAEAGNDLFVGTSVGLFKSSDAGANWAIVATYPTTSHVFGLTSHQGRLITFGYYSDDNGSSWSAGGDYTGAIPAIASRYNGMYPGAGDTLYAWSTSNFASATNNGIAYTVDKGNTWVSVDKTGLGSFDLQSFQDLVYFNGNLYGTAYLGVVSDKSSGVGIASFYKPEAKFNAYPNPAKETVTLSNLTSGSIISIKDMTGKIVYNSLVNGEQIIVNTADFANGIYIIHVENSGNFTNRKLVVNR